MRLAFQLMCGLAAGVAARALLPGHHPGSFLLAAVLSLAGALAGGMSGDRLLPPEVADAGGCVLSALGAIAMLLVHAMFTA